MELVNRGKSLHYSNTPVPIVPRQFRCNEVLDFHFDRLGLTG